MYSESTLADLRGLHRRLSEIFDEPELRARHLALAAARGDPLTLRSLDSAAHMARLRGSPGAAELLELAIDECGDDEVLLRTESMAQVRSTNAGA